MQLSVDCEVLFDPKKDDEVFCKSVNWRLASFEQKAPTRWRSAVVLKLFAMRRI